MMRHIVIADVDRTGGVLPIRRHLRAAPDYLSVAASDWGSVLALLIRAEADTTGLSRWRWYCLSARLPVPDALNLAIGGEA